MFTEQTFFKKSFECLCWEWRVTQLVILLCHKAPNPAASEFIPKGAPRMATMAQSAVQAFPSPLFPHPGLSSSTAAALAPGECKHDKLRNYSRCTSSSSFFF